MRKGRIKLKNCTIAVVSFMALAAIGYVCSSELPGEQDIHRIYSEADQRMYEDKRSMKEEIQRENPEK